MPRSPIHAQGRIYTAHRKIAQQTHARNETTVAMVSYPSQAEPTNIDRAIVHHPPTRCSFKASSRPNSTKFAQPDPLPEGPSREKLATLVTDWQCTDGTYSFGVGTRSTWSLPTGDVETGEKKDAGSLLKSWRGAKAAAVAGRRSLDTWLGVYVLMCTQVCTVDAIIMPYIVWGTWPMPGL